DCMKRGNKTVLVEVKRSVRKKQPATPPLPPTLEDLPEFTHISSPEEAKRLANQLFKIPSPAQESISKDIAPVPVLELEASLPPNHTRRILPDLKDPVLPPPPHHPAADLPPAPRKRGPKPGSKRVNKVLASPQEPSLVLDSDVVKRALSTIEQLEHQKRKVRHHQRSPQDLFDLRRGSSEKVAEPPKRRRGRPRKPMAMALPDVAVDVTKRAIQGRKRRGPILEPDA